MDSPREHLYRFLRWSERYTKTDMVYLASGGFWLILEQVVNAVLVLLLAVAFGHFASQDTYGNYKYILAIAGLLGALTLSGLPTAVTQAAARGFDGSLKQGARLMLRWSVLVVVVALSAAVYYAFIGHNFFLAAGFLVIGLCTPLLNAYSLFDAFLLGKKEFGRHALYAILDLLLPILAVITALFLTRRAIVLVVVYFVANTLSAFVFYLLTQRRIANRSEEPGLLSYGGHLSVMNVIATIADRIDSIIVFMLLGPAQLAVYAYAIAMPEQIKGMVKIVPPLTMARFTQRSMEEIRATIWTRIGILLFALAGILGAYILVAPAIFHYLFPVYKVSAHYSQIYALSILFSAVVPLTSVLQAHKRTRELYLVSNLGSIALLVTLPVFCWLWGIAGAIASQFVFRAVTALSTLVFFRRAKS